MVLTLTVQSTLKKVQPIMKTYVEHIKLIGEEGLEIYLPSSKTDRGNRGRILIMPALKRLCPVAAYEHWLLTSALQRRPVFRAIGRWGTWLNKRSMPIVLPGCCAKPLPATGGRIHRTVDMPCDAASLPGPAATSGAARR